MMLSFVTGKVAKATVDAHGSAVFEAEGELSNKLNLDFGSFDLDDNGSLSKTEFSRVFRAADHNKDGFLDQSETSDMLETFGKSLKIAKGGRSGSGQKGGGFDDMTGSYGTER